MEIIILDQAYDPWIEIAKYQQRNLAPGGYGACSVFVGSMRDFNQGCEVSFMQLEHYAGMTESLLQQHAAQVVKQHQLLDLLVLHRVGKVTPNDAIVVVASWSAHRAAAFDATRDMMEYLKSNAPFWKKESLADEHERWVDNS